MSDYFNNTEWKAQRLGKFTASEIYKLLKGGRKKDELFGQTALTYINEKIAEILTGEAPELTNIKALEWGSANELDAVLLFSQQHHETVENFGTGNPQFFPFHAIAGGSPDALTATAVIEVKCPWNSANHVDFLKAARTMATHGEWLHDNKEEYWAQIQFNMICCGKDTGFLVSYDPRVIQPEHRLAILSIEKDGTFHGEIVTRLDAAKNIVLSTLNSFETADSEPEAITLQPINS